MVRSFDKAEKILHGLNSRQRDAVETIDGPVLILAGPGSGKTRVITSRIAYLRHIVGVAPFRIAAVTFTNKAAREMKERLSTMLGKDLDSLSVNTFHSFCAQILRREYEHIGINRDFTIYDDTDQMSLMKQVLLDINLDPKRFPPRSILSAISGAKSQLIGVSGLSSQSTNYWDEIVARAYERYEEMLIGNSAVDFDDLIFKTYLLFRDVPQVARTYQNKFAHLMIDEFQDTNIAQYALAKQVIQKTSNICVVGDPDQSIYTWRNADIRNILSFQTDYPSTKIISLEENYRSTQTILDAATSLIKTNTQRVEKDLWTKNGKGNPIIVSEKYDEREEAQFVINEIQTLLKSPKNKYNLSDVAVMYRVNAQSRALEEACVRYGMPYQLIGGLKFYQRQEIKDVVAYLRLTINPDDDISLTRIINTPTRGIGQRTLDQVLRMARNRDISIISTLRIITSEKHTKEETGLASRAVKALADFLKILDEITSKKSELNLVDFIDLIMERSGYQRYLMDSANVEHRGEERIENIKEFKSTAAEFALLGHQEGLSAFLESVSLISDIDSLEEKSEAITLITLHQAKGLEFSVVFIVGMEEGLLPHIRSLDSGDPSELEEERRLCYVGVTRAKEQLYLLRAFRRGFRGGSEPSVPSRFLVDIPPTLISPETLTGENRKAIGHAEQKSSLRNRVTSTSTKSSPYSSSNVKKQVTNQVLFQVGDKVNHDIFGEGMVVSVKPSREDSEITVAFDGAGIKRLLQSLAPLNKSV